MLINSSYSHWVGTWNFRKISPALAAAPSKYLGRPYDTPESKCRFVLSCSRYSLPLPQIHQSSSFQKRHDFLRRIAPINHKRTMSVLLSQGGRVCEIKGNGRPRMRPKLIKQCRIFAAPALVKHSFSRKVSELGIIASSLFQGPRANQQLASGYVTTWAVSPYVTTWGAVCLPTFARVLCRCSSWVSADRVLDTRLSWKSVWVLKTRLPRHLDSNWQDSL